jgi:hypothetical protein
VVDVERIADSCGFAVRYYELVDERPVLDAHSGKATADKFATPIVGTGSGAGGIHYVPASGQGHTTKLAGEGRDEQRNTT